MLLFHKTLFSAIQGCNALRFVHFNYITDPSRLLHMNSSKKLLNTGQYETRTSKKT
jgi:hypothetical protein